MHQLSPMAPSLPLTETERTFTPSWEGIPVVDIRSRGFFGPLIGLLQKQAAFAVIFSISIVHVGIGWIAYRLFHLLSPDVRRAFLASAHVRWTLLIGAVSALAGYGIASLWNVSISGMIAATLGIVFGIVVLAAPKQGLVAQSLRRRRQRSQFAVEMLIVHLSTHLETPEEKVESTLLHLERELGWDPERAAQIAQDAEQRGFIKNHDGALTLTPAGNHLAATVAAR